MNTIVVIKTSLFSITPQMQHMSLEEVYTVAPKTF